MTGYITLSHQVKFYVPSTKDRGTTIDNDELNIRVERVAGLFSDWFGGATVQRAQGYYKTHQGEIIVEDVRIVIASSSDDNLAKHTRDVLNLAKTNKTAWTQESTGVEIDNQLLLIE